MWSFGNLARSHRYSRHHNRAEGMSTSKKSAMVDAGIYKGAAVVTAGLCGGISAYKGLPEIKNFAGFDVIAGVLLSGAEFYMLWKGGSDSKAIAAVGGVSTGLLCHWAAVQGTIWGATKAKAEGLASHPSFAQTDVGGWDNNHYADPSLPQSHTIPAQQPSGRFDVNYGMM